MRAHITRSNYLCQLRTKLDSDTDDDTTVAMSLRHLPMLSSRRTYRSLQTLPVVYHEMTKHKWNSKKNKTKQNSNFSAITLLKFSIFLFLLPNPLSCICSLTVANNVSLLYFEINSLIDQNIRKPKHRFLYHY